MKRRGGKSLLPNRCPLVIWLAESARPSCCSFLRYCLVQYNPWVKQRTKVSNASYPVVTPWWLPIEYRSRLGAGDPSLDELHARTPERAGSTDRVIGREVIAVNRCCGGSVDQFSPVIFTARQDRAVA